MCTLLLHEERRLSAVLVTSTDGIYSAMRGRSVGHPKPTYANAPFGN